MPGECADTWASCRSSFLSQTEPFAVINSPSEGPAGTTVILRLKPKLSDHIPRSVCRCREWRRSAPIGDLVAAFVLGLATFYGILEYPPRARFLHRTLCRFPRPALLRRPRLRRPHRARLAHPKGRVPPLRLLRARRRRRKLPPPPILRRVRQAVASLRAARPRPAAHHPPPAPHRWRCALVLAMFGMWARTFATRQLLAQTPDWLLIRQVGVLSWGDLQENWPELGRRTLSPQSDRQLIETLLNRRTRPDGSLPSALAVYIQSCVNSATLPSDLANPAPARRALSCSPHHPRIRRGRRCIPIDIVGPFSAVDRRRRHAPGPALRCDDRRATWHSLAGRPHRPPPSAPAPRIFSHAVRTEKPGVVAVEVRGWFFVGQPDQIIKYDDAGAPRRFP